MVEFTSDFVTQAPLIGEERLLSLLSEHFGVDGAKITPLSGYDDLNFLLENVRTERTEVERLGDKFVCKFSNPMEARNPEVMDSQIKLMAHLRKAGIPTASAVPTRSGANFAMARMTESGMPFLTLPMRLFTFLPGVPLEKIGYSPAVYSLLGDLLARFHTATEDFEDECIRETRILITCEQWDHLEAEFRTLVQTGAIEGENQAVCSSIFRRFRSEILDRRGEFAEGLIHSDLNETNVLLERRGNTIEVTGVLDFGDSHYSLRLIDVATALVYLLLDSPAEKPPDQEWPRIAADFLAGYTKRRSVDADGRTLQLAACARLVASLVYGLRTVRVNSRGDDPSYILKTQATGWEVLKLLSNPELQLIPEH